MLTFISDIESAILNATPNALPGLAFKLASNHRNIGEYDSGEERVFQVCFDELERLGQFNCDRFAGVFGFTITWRYHLPKDQNCISAHSVSSSDALQTANIVLRATFTNTNIYAVQFVSDSGLQEAEDADSLYFRAIKFTVEIV